MSIHIDEVARVDAVLVEGTWLGVEPGTLERHMPVNRSSTTNAVIYRWAFAGQEFMASAEDVSAVRFTPRQ